MKARNKELKYLAVLLLLICGVTDNVLATSTYYGRGTATVSSASPTGAGYVYVNSSNDNGGGTYTTTTSNATGSADGERNSSATVTVYAFARAANDNYEFVGWNTSNGTTATTLTNNPQTISGNANSTNQNRPTNLGTLYAIFAEKPLFYFSATAVAAPAGGGTASVSPATTSVRGAHWNSTSATTTLTFTAIPNTGYRFLGWSTTSDGAVVSTASPYNYTATSNSTSSGSPVNTTFYAKFEQVPVATAVSATPSVIDACVGDVKTFTYSLTPANAYDNVTVTSGNTSVATVSKSGNTITVNCVANGSTTVTLSAKDYSDAEAASTTVAVTVRTQCAAPSIVGYDNSTGKVTITPAASTTVYYTIDGSDPTDESTVYGEPFDLASPATVKAVAYRTDYCPSTMVSLAITQVAKPTITIDNTGVTFSGAAGATYYYSVDGSAPTTQWDGSPITGLSDGDVIKVIAKRAGMINSEIATKSYQIPNGVSGGVVTLNDREDHTWTYYAGVDASVDGGSYNTNYAGTMYSPNPRNVKITYQGNGGAVAWNAPQTEFVYYKTIEQINGKYSYTLIPNPFSKRPTEGSGNSRWRGFSTWKVVSVDGGTITSTDGNTTYAANSTIPAETEICFNPTRTYTTNGQSMEVVFAAVWVQAYVVTSVTTTGLNGSSYETNFIVLTSGTSNDINNFGAAATVSALYPNGTTDGTNAPAANWTPTTGISGTFSCSNNTKVEYIRMSGSGTITANNHYLILGRGITGGGTNGLCADIVQGMANTASNAQLNYHIRIESGIYNYLSFTNGYNSRYGTRPGQNNNQVVTFSANNNFIKGTLGCDYDRATSNNTLLKVQQEMFYGYYSAFSNAGNASRETFNVVAKSGDFCSAKSNDIADADESFYASLGGQQTNVGRRVLTIEGGQFLSIAGGIDANNSETYETFFVRMKGGTLRGALYGAGAFAAAQGHRRYVITGGTVNGWIAGGCNGTDPNQSGGTLPSNTYLYIGGKTHVGNNTDITINTSTDGNIFGAGSGNSAQATTGQVNNSNVVIADECYVKRNVYGGGNYGYSNATATVYVTGGEVAGSVFGGSNQKQGVTVNVNMTGGQVDNGVYGGSNTSGTISGNVTMSINGGTVGDGGDGDGVFGGGYGNSTIVSGNVSVTLGASTSAADSATVNGNVYGGSALGRTNNGSATNTTTVTMNKALVNGNLFGGAYGNGANVNGRITVNVNGGRVDGNVFGGGDAAAYNKAGQNYPVVNMTGGKVTNIFGGGKGSTATVTGNPHVTLSGDAQVGGNVFGGGDAAAVTGSTQVTIRE